MALAKVSLSTDHCPSSNCQLINRIIRGLLIGVRQVQWLADTLVERHSCAAIHPTIIGVA